MTEKKNDETRREFLVRAAVGAGAVAGAGLAPIAQGQEHAQQHSHAEHREAGEGSAGQAHAAHMGGEQQRAFFNREDAATVAAFTERLMPGAPGKAGATEAGVLNYIDLALAGAYADLQDFYRRGLAQLDAYCRKAHGQAFALLGAAQQDEVIAALEAGKATEFAWPSAQEFFNTLRIQTMEGMFADPMYGGNRNFSGWRLVGFPGAQAVFTTEDMKSTQAFTREPIVGMQAGMQAPTKRPAGRA